MRISVAAAAVALALSTLASPATAAVTWSHASASTQPASAAALARTYRGTGDDVIRIRATKTRGILVARYRGESNFIVYGLDKRGRDGQVLINEIGAYSGTVMYNAAPGDVLTGLKIEAEGPWTLTFKPLSAAPRWKTRTVRGTGDKVLKIYPPSRGPRTVRGRYYDEGNFIVYGHTTVRGYPDVLFNEIGDYSGKTTLPSGTRYVVIQSDGRWYLRR